MAPQLVEDAGEVDNDGSRFPRLGERRVTFDDRNNYLKNTSFYRRLVEASQKEEWSVVSPMMTRHLIPSERSIEPVRLPRRRSRSFDYFIENKQKYCADLDGFDIYGESEKLKHSNRKRMDESPRKQIDDPTANSRCSDHAEGKDIYNETDDMPFFMSVLYGLINCTIVLPVIMSFGNIIYRDNAFSDYMPVLIKLTLFSGMVHQLCFSFFSTLKFAVGSVQDAGLIFLAKMAHDMVRYCRENGHDDEIMMATVTIGLGCAAAALGVGLIIISKLGLASYVQMLPTCVVAGYLAFIGWFVGYSGLGIMAGESSLTFGILVNKSIFVLPGVFGGAFIYIMVRKLRHVAILPLCITTLLVVFYAILIITGSTVEDATEAGWIRKSQNVPAWNETWDFLKIDKVAWGALPQLWMTWLGMLFVVALSSSLDVAAIELEMKTPLNYNKELRVVGISNLISGLTGGYTGSYIFSQTIFSLRIGVRSRIPGFAIAFFTLVILIMPFPILSYVPNFFYGSLLSMICIDLMYEWLWEFRSKVTIAEYILGLTTFGLIQIMGVEYGIVAGVLVYVLCRKLNIDVGELKKVHSEEKDFDEEDTENFFSDPEGTVFEDEETDDDGETTRLFSNGDGKESYITF